MSQILNAYHHPWAQKQTKQFTRMMFLQTWKEPHIYKLLVPLRPKLFAPNGWQGVIWGWLVNGQTNPAHPAPPIPPI